MIAELTLGEMGVACQCARNSLNGRITDPKRIVNGRPGVELAVIGEYQERRAAYSVLIREALDVRRKLRLQTGRVQLRIPEMTVVRLQLAGRLASQETQPSRTREIINGNADVQGETRGVDVPGRHALAQSADVVGCSLPAVQSAA
jgi:hypothetical protein